MIDIFSTSTAESFGGSLGSVATPVCVRAQIGATSQVSDSGATQFRLQQLALLRLRLWFEAEFFGSVRISTSPGQPLREHWRQAAPQRRL